MTLARSLADARRPPYSGSCGANLRRLMARLNMSMADVVDATGLDERTVRSILRGRAQPQAKTLHKLAAGLGVDADELFAEERPLLAAFNRATNPAVARVIGERPDLFKQWSRGDFDELFSRVAVGGELTDEGAVAAAQQMNRRRELLAQAAVVFESPESELLGDFISLLYRRVTVISSSGSLPSTGMGATSTGNPMLPERRR